MALAPGMQVTESIRLLEPLGEGGMASVWIAEHAALRTKVAVKFIAEDLLEHDPSILKRFEREAMAAAQIKSPHVVQTLDHGSMADGTPYIVMELLEGEDLRTRLDRERHVPLEELATMLSQVSKALSKAHAAGIVHRDIKPDNIFLVDGGDDEIFVKVLDFGVAKHSAAQGNTVVTSTGAMIGTPGYMSPEQVLHGSRVDLRSDLWSLGVVAYHCMIGDIPFQGETLGALCVSISRGAYVPPSQLRADLPRAVDQWMSRLLALHPDDRFQSARQAAETFREALRGISPPSAADAGRAPPPGPLGAAQPAPDRAKTKLWQRPSEQDQPTLHAPRPAGADVEPADSSSKAEAVTRAALASAERELPSTVPAPAIGQHGRLLLMAVAGFSFVVGFILVLLLTSSSESAPDASAAAVPAPSTAAADAERRDPPADTTADGEDLDLASAAAAEAAPAEPEPAQADSESPAIAPTPRPRALPPLLPAPAPEPSTAPAPQPTAKDRGF